MHKERTITLRLPFQLVILWSPGFSRWGAGIGYYESLAYLDLGWLTFDLERLD